MMRYMLKMQPPREGLSALMLDAMQVAGWRDIMAVLRALDML